MKIIVTGGAGFIGSHLVDRLVKMNHRVVVLDNLLTGKKENINPRARFYKIDICSHRISYIFRKERPAVVFHLAAVPRVPLSLKDPVLTSKVNILGTVNVLKTAVEMKTGRLIFASSSSVYGEQRKMPLKENMTPNPISPYGLQKYVCEKFLKMFSQLYKIITVSLRYFNVYGPRIDFDSEYALVMGRFLKQKADGKPLTIYGSGNQTRGFCYVSDVVDATIKAMESKKLRGGEIINVGSEKSYTINYLARLIGGEINYLPPRPGDVLHTRADISLAKRLLDWEPKTSLEVGIEKTKKWFEDSYKKKY